jgi:hypothetical protein
MYIQIQMQIQKEGSKQKKIGKNYSFVGFLKVTVVNSRSRIKIR